MVDPAHTILNVLGGPSVVARVLGVGANTASRWRYPASRGGTDGIIPRKYHDRLLAYASEQGIELPRGAFADPALMERKKARKS